MMTTMTMTKIAPPAWLLAFWKEIDDKSFERASVPVFQDIVMRGESGIDEGAEIFTNLLKDLKK